MIAALTGAFYVLLPQLAHVDDSFAALSHADWPWLIVCILMSLITYVAAAVGMAGGIPQPLPFVANVEAQMASSFVNRVTPANVGGMALNLRFLQKAGIDPPTGGDRSRPQRRDRRDRPHRAALRVHRVGRTERHQQLQDPDRQQDPGRDRGGARAHRDRDRDQLGTPHAAQARLRLPEAIVGEHRRALAFTRRSWPRCSEARCS